MQTGNEQSVTSIQATRVPLKFDDRVIGYADVSVGEEDPEDAVYLPPGFVVIVEGHITDEAVSDLFVRTMGGLSISLDALPVGPVPDWKPIEGEN